MSDVLTLPILSLPDLVVLPGMVVPVELDSDARAVIDAARAGSGRRRPAAAGPPAGRPLPASTA